MGKTKREQQGHLVYMFKETCLVAVPKFVNQPLSVRTVYRHKADILPFRMLNFSNQVAKAPQALQTDADLVGMA
jgi:hypothetical protein